MPTAMRGSLALILTIAAGLACSPAAAQIDKCQAALTKNSQKLETQLAKGFEKCLSSIRKGLVKGKPAADGAAACEKTLDKLLGLGVVDPTKTKVGKFLATVEKLDTTGVCTATELEELGHLVGGMNAPGVGTTDFVASWLAVAKKHTAWVEHVIDNGDARDLLDLALGATPVNGDPGECDAASGQGCGTNCSGAPASGYAYRPNLCALNPANFPECRLHACHLKSTGGVLQPAGAPISFANAKFALEVCRVPSSGLPISGSNFVFLKGEPLRTFNPPPSVPFVPAVTWCVDQVRAEGWCDCTGQAVPLSPQSCLDHIADAGGSCSDDGATIETDCVCASPAGQPCGGPGCTSCLNAKTGARCHPGTDNSAINTTYTGASVAGDCLYLSTMQFRFLAPATCVNAAGEALGSCNVVGPPTATCTALGGTSCVSSVGVDGIACTRDDRTPSEATVTVPFTTGTARSTIENYINSEGVCVAPAFGMNCVSHADCDSTGSPGSGVCAAMVPGCGTGPNPEDCRYTTATGAGLSCPTLEAGNLGGFTLMGSLPALEAPPGLADYILTFELECN